MTEQRTGEMEPGHDHRTGVICHLPEELSAQPTGKGVNSQVLKVNYTMSSASVLLLWLTQTYFVIKSLCSFVFNTGTAGRPFHYEVGLKLFFFFFFLSEQQKLPQP